MWSSGQVLIHFHVAPTLPLVWLFAGGALAAFGLLQLATCSSDPPADLQLGGSPSWPRAGAVRAIAVAASLTAVTVAGSPLSPALSWLAGAWRPYWATSGSSVSSWRSRRSRAPDATYERPL